MYPRQHAVISGIATFFAAVIAGVSPITVVWWTILGAAAGVLIDVDHVVLAMMVGRKVKEGVEWFQHPVRAVTKPDALLADIDYDALVYHRMISHILILIVFIVMTRISAVFIPVVLGLIAHILADIVWDVKHGTYRFSR